MKTKSNNFSEYKRKKMMGDKLNMHDYVQQSTM